MVHQGYIEPHNAVGIYSSDGHATIYCSTQGPFEVRSLSARVLGMPVGNIKVVPAEIGGGFGGKTTIYLEPLSVVLSKKTGQPVKMVMTALGSAARQRPDLGLPHQGQDGSDQGRQDYRRRGLDGLRGGRVSGLAGRRRRDDASSRPYAIENLQIDGYDVVVNKPKTAAYRAPGATNAAFASESRDR